MFKHDDGSLTGLVHACWEKNLDMSSDDVLKQVISQAQYDADRIMQRANSDEIKKALRARTKEAKDVGLCGVPSYRIFRRGINGSDWKQVGDLVWGQDELAVVEDLIAGGEDGVATVGSGIHVSDRSKL